MKQMKAFCQHRVESSANQRHIDMMIRLKMLIINDDSSIKITIIRLIHAK
jgi:hypothetical protein